MGLGIGVCVITYNEEGNIRRCLESVKWVDEIVVVDSYSTDRTVEIAREYTDRVILREFGGYVDQKNYALSCSSCRWVLCLDADEELSEGLGEEIRELFRGGEPEGVVGFYVRRKSLYLGSWVRYGGWYPDRKLRLFRRDCGYWGGVDPHDRVVLRGRAGYLRGEILHRTYRNLSHHLEVINHFTTVAAREKFRRGGVRFLFLRCVFHPLFAFFYSYVFRWGFLYGARGLILAVMGSYYAFLKYAKLWELRYVLGGEGEEWSED